MRISDPIEYLRGDWEFERKVHSGPDRGRASGIASFRPEGEGLSWKEAGRLEFGQASTSASREMSIERDGNGWIVRFEDGRPFHLLDLGPGHCEVEHLCRDDVYGGRIEARDANTFFTSWRVAGPLKEQLIETTYRRLTEP